ncbi:MAG: NAD(P)H-dependent oxidoreductase [Quadrisphaera sp.]
MPLAQPVTLGVVVGSLRAASTTRRVAQALLDAAPPVFVPSFITIGDLPLYDEDLDVEVAAEPPPAWARFRAEVAACDALLFVTPEYNRSVPAPLKNAVDVGSAPHERNAFRGRPAAVVSASPGRLGAFGANHHLRQSLVFLDVPTMPQPELYLSGSAGLFDTDGALADPATHERLAAFMRAFAVWVQRHATVPA